MCDFFDKPKAAVMPGRTPDPVKEAEAVVKKEDASTLTSQSTGVSMKQSKRGSRKGVPGLNL